MQVMKKQPLGQQILLSQLKGMIIFDRHDLRPLGLIESVIFRSKNLQVAFLQCLSGGSTNYIRADQTAVVKNLLTIPGAECFGEKEDFIREKTTFEQDCRLLDYKVCDMSGKKLGNIEDCSIKLPLMNADRLYVRRPLLKSLHQGSLILPTTAIQDIQPDKKLLVVQSEVAATKKAAIKPLAA